MIAPVLSLALQAAPTGGTSFMPFLVQMVLIFGIVYFLLIRPQAQQRKKHEAALRVLKRGDEVVTAGGLVGEVVHIKEELRDGQPMVTMQDRVTMRTGESKVVVERGRIATVRTTDGESSAPPSRSGSTP